MNRVSELVARIMDEKRISKREARDILGNTRWAGWREVYQCERKRGRDRSRNVEVVR